MPHRNGVGAHLAEQHVGVDVGQVADEDRHALAVATVLAPPAAGLVLTAELDVGRRGAGGVGSVHDVVVHQGEGVEQLEGGPGVDDAGIVRVAPGTHEGPVAERRPQALPAGIDQMA